MRLPDALIDGLPVARCLIESAAATPRARLRTPDCSTPGLAGAGGAQRRAAHRRGHGEQFVPQMVNLELVGGVNFQKGCYPGQEVVARSQYRGTLKRRGLC
jgi:folate-binding protein YgfZ